MSVSAVSPHRLGRRAGWVLFCLARGILPLLLVGPVLATAGWGATGQDSLARLKSLSVEELLQVEVTTASRRPERLAEAAYAVQVIGPNDIRRSGAVTLPELLRLAPNLHVARSSASSWGITARGFNDTTNTSNKLLVMIDGRSVYSPLFSGTFWDVQSVFLPDVDRIEIVSGPGGSTWGANAVNGVINVLTKSARDTPGGLLYAGAGIESRVFAGVRQGGQVGRDTYYRVFAKHHEFDDTERASGAEGDDRWMLTHGGFRVDHLPPGGPKLTLQGDLYRGWSERPDDPRTRLHGGNLLARYTRRLSGGSELEVLGYYDRAERHVPGSFSDVLHTWNFDAQQHLEAGDRHDVVWGVGFRQWHDRIDHPPAFALLPPTTTERLASAFVQDEIALRDDTIRLTLGTKYEYSSYSGSEWQPNVRIAWRVHPEHTVWAAASRAVRTPSRVDRDFYIPATPPHTVFAGGPEFESESLWAYELGWRGTASHRVSWAATLFYHDYDDLRSLEGPFPLVIANGVEGHTYGSELSLSHEPFPWLRWSAGYTFLHRDIQPEPGSRDINRGMAEAADPRHQALLRVAIDLPRRWELDLALRHVDRLEVRTNGLLRRIPAYTELSARLGWHVRNDLELSVSGHNLLHDDHLELGSATDPREVQRAIRAQAIWQF